MEDYDPKEFLLFALQHFDIRVVSHEGKHIWLEDDYEVEIEGRSLFRLLQKGQVIAPFDSVEEICRFILVDRASE